MDFTANLADLRGALATLKPAVASRGSLPVLTGVRLECWPGTLELVATDLDLTVKTQIDADVAAPGTVLLAHRLLADASKGKGRIHVSDDGPDTVQVVNGHTSRLRTMILGEYPKVPVTINGGWTRIIPTAALAAVVSAASREQTRPILTGVLFTGDTLVSTDSYRLHVEPTGCEALEASLLIPSSTIAAVLKAKADSVRLHHTRIGEGVRGTEATFTAGRTTWVTRIIEGDFPNYRQLIPDVNTMPATITVDRAAFMAELAPLAVQAKAIDSTCPVRIGMGADELTLTVTSQDVGDFTATVACQCVGAAPATVAFNPAYLADGLRTLAGDTVTMSMIDHLKPMLLGDGTGSIRLLMPVRVS